MSNNPHIQYIARQDIDERKWNDCILHAANGLVYAQTKYLDLFAAHWDALVLDDYKAVMPITWNKKYGFYYLYQPLFLPQLGVLGNDITIELLQAFLAHIPHRFRLWDIDLHESNDPAAYMPHCTARVNMLLSLTPSYEAIAHHYHRLATRQLRKATEEGLVIREHTDPGENIRFYARQYPGMLGKGADREAHYTQAFGKAQEWNDLISLTAYKGNELVGMYMLLKDTRNVHSIIGGTSAAGKEWGAFYDLTDYAIRLCSGSNRVFRFEGSDKSGIAAFNSQFGPTPIRYFHLKINRLPWPVRYLK